MEKCVDMSSKLC